MNIQNRPVVGSTTPRAYNQPPAVGGGAPITVAVNNYQAQGTAGASGGILGTLSGMFSGFVNAIKNIFGKLFGANSAPTALPGSTGTVTPAPSTGGIAGDDATLSAQFGLLNTPQNVAAFKQALGAAQAEAGVIGPGNTNAEAITELQQVLAGWGFPVQQNGQFDPATADAVIRFKTANGLSEGFVFANGQPGATPFVDAKTRAKMVELLTSSSAPATATAPAPTPSVPTPATPSPAPSSDLAVKLHLAPDAANVAAYQAAAAALVAQGAFGPDNMPADAVGELQSVLAGWGYQVAPSGQFDQATIDALLQFKMANNLTDARFKMADGTVGVTPFVDEATQAVMVAKLQGTPAPAPAPAPAPTPAPGTNQYQGGLSAEDAEIAKGVGLLPTSANVAAFKAVAAALQAETEVVGPDTNSSPAAVQELQQVLAGWGYAVQQTGQFDQATIDAVMKFKRDKGLTYGYQMADGSAGVHPYIDSRTKDLMIKLLGG